MNTFEFSTCSSLVCGVDAVTELPAMLKGLGVSKALVVTDPGLLNTGIVSRVCEFLDAAGMAFTVYSDVQADPPEAVVLSAAEFARDETINGVIGLGGGSSLDVAKLISVLADSDHDIAQTLKSIYGVDMIKGARLPLIQVPTTAGTGSEVTPISIVTTGETQKTGIVSKRLLPDFAILDAKLTVGLPAQVTAATGVDAMVHAIEAYTSKSKKNVYSDMLARQALQMLSSNIRTAVSDGANIQARQEMLLGSMLAGQAFANAPVAAVHALAYPLGGHFHLPHGLSNSLVLPPVLRFNAQSVPSLYAQLLEFVNPDSNLNTDAARCEGFIEELESIIDDVGLPKTLRECGIGRQDLPNLASDAMLQQRLLVNNPVVVTEHDALEIYNRVY
ncbi:MAG: alcohol dehydrogenase [Gammaproteobacteria bacterium]|nr:alcohol dehydrogenase [Gammaproteobacteria bacterium]